MLSRPTGYFFPLSGCVLREPSGHNLMHPTTWCPPNKWWVSTCQIYGKMWLPVGEKAALSILLSLNSTSLPPPANPGYRDGLYPHRLMADKIPLTETAYILILRRSGLIFIAVRQGRVIYIRKKVWIILWQRFLNIWWCVHKKNASSILLLPAELLYMARALFLVFFLFVVWMFLSYLSLNWMICIL